MLTTLLQQAQQLQAVQNQLATVPPTAHTAPEPESQPVFNTVSSLYIHFSYDFHVATESKVKYYFKSLEKVCVA